MYEKYAARTRPRVCASKLFCLLSVACASAWGGSKKRAQGPVADEGKALVRRARVHTREMRVLRSRN